MEYTIKQAGNRWVATNGRQTVEDESPDEALFGLLSGEIEATAGCGDFDAGPSNNRKMRANDRIGEHCVRLLQLLAIDAPEMALLSEIEQIRKRMAEWLGS